MLMSSSDVHAERNIDVLGNLQYTFYHYHPFPIQTLHYQSLQGCFDKIKQIPFPDYH